MTPDPVDDPKDPKDDAPKDPPPKDEATFTAADKANLEAALAKERTDRRKFEKDARDAQAKLDAAAAETLSETEKAEARATAAEEKVTKATEKLRKVNLLTALSDAKVANPKAAARLLDGVEYDEDTDEPKNLDDAIKAAKSEYGEGYFKAGKTAPAEINGGGGDGNGNGPSLNAEELKAANAAGMSPEEFQHYQDPKAGPFVPAGKT